MKSNNSIYITYLVIFSLLGCMLFYSFYLQNNMAVMSKFEVSQEKYSESDIDDMAVYEYVSDFNSAEEAIAATGYTPIKKYEYYGNTYFFVPEMVEDSAGHYYYYVLYRYISEEKKLYKNYKSGLDGGRLTLSHDGDWYDHDFATAVLFSYIDSRDFLFYIAGGDQFADVFHGAWVGDEIKNFSFSNGKFEYTFIGEKNGRNIYFWTYELKDSQKLLSTLVIRERGEGADVKESLRCKDVEKLLGIRCKYRMDSRIVIYILYICAFLVMTAVLISNTYVTNKSWGNNTGKTVFLWLITGVLCVLSVILIMYFIYNPHLVFGGRINHWFNNITGHDLPNPPEIVHQYDP